MLYPCNDATGSAGSSENKERRLMRVFILDDHPAIRERLIALIADLEKIEGIGYSESAGEALEAIRLLKPDAVILDIRLPDGNGMDILSKIKESNPAPVVIMLTNYPYPQYRKRCMEAGADFFFDKSTEFEKVTQVLRNMA